ncbi:Rha family transcriptional regulator [Methylobacterium phyllosphaerae]
MLSFEHTYRNEQNGQEYPCYRLPKRELMVLVTGYSVAMRAALVDRVEQLEAECCSSTEICRFSHKCNIDPRARVCEYENSSRTGVSLLSRIDFNATRSFDRSAAARTA